MHRKNSAKHSDPELRTDQLQNEPTNKKESRGNPNIREIGVATGFKPGVSGNPGGRPKKLPITEGYLEQLQRPLAGKLRRKVEKATGEELPEDFTYGEAIALMRVHEAVTKPEATREVREAIEGKATQRLVSTVEPQAEPESKEDIKKVLWAWFAETEYERCMLYNMPVPEDTIETAKMLGVPLELPPCQQEQGQNTKEARNEQGKPEAPSEGEGERDKPSRDGNELKN